MTRANNTANTHRSTAPAAQVPVSQHKQTEVLKKASSSPLDTEWQWETLQSKDWDQNSSCTDRKISKSPKMLICIRGTSRFANDPDKQRNGYIQWPFTTKGTAGTGESNSLLAWQKKVKKGRAAGITDQGAEETGKETAMNCWNSLLQEITRTNTAGSTEHQTWWKPGPGRDLWPLG